jgi:hypothetical protein
MVEKFIIVKAILVFFFLRLSGHREETGKKKIKRMKEKAKSWKSIIL